MICECEICKLCRRISAVKDSANVTDLTKLVDDLAELYINADFDLDYMNCIRYGTWDNSVEILTRWLEAAKARQIKDPGTQANAV